MNSIKRIVVIVSGIALMTACQDIPTSPLSRTPSQSVGRVAIIPDPGLVTFNSGSCSLTDASNGAVSCSWNLSNPDENTLNFFAEALLIASYDCVNPKNGRIASSQTREVGTAYGQSGVSSASLTGTDVALPLPALPSGYTGSQKKLNACNGNTVVQNLTWSLDYWDFAVAAVGGTLRQSCYGSDDRFGCFTN